MVLSTLTIDKREKSTELLRPRFALAAAAVMAASAEMLWPSTAISLSVLCLTVVLLLMARWWPSKADAESVGSDDDSETTDHDSSSERLATQVKELETTGDLDGAAALLLSAWTTKGSSRAVTLAHELSQRYPAQAFQMGCPLQQGIRVSDVDLDLAPTLQEQHDSGDADDGDSDAVDDSTPATPAVSTCEAVATNTGVDITAPERFSGEDVDRGPPSPALISENDYTSGGGGGAEYRDGNDERDGGISARETPSPPTTTTTSTSTPWERGWQGPEGFKPPPSSSASCSNHAPSPEFGSTSISSSSPQRVAEEGVSGREQAGLLRNFTISQLNAFDGGVPAPVVRGGVMKALKPRPIYIALRGDVYDASAGKHLYGPVSKGRLP